MSEFLLVLAIFMSYFHIKSFIFMWVLSLCALFALLLSLSSKYLLTIFCLGGTIIKNGGINE